MKEDSNSDTYSSGDDLDYEPHTPYLSDKATHLLELSSISIRCDMFKKFPHVQLVGYVILTDQYGDTFTLFDESCSDDLLALGPCDDFLEIKLGTSERNRPLLLSELFVLNLILKDKSREIVIMEEHLRWDFSGAVVYDKQLQRHFDTAGNGLVRVCYTIFRYALFASVNTSVKNKQEDDLHATVSGTIIATRKLWNGSIPRVLFDQLHSDKTMLASTGLCLSSRFPVPAYSSFEIQAKLKINNEKIESGEHELEFKIFENHLYPCKKVIKGKTWDIMMEVIMTNVVIFDSDNKNSSMSGEEAVELLGCNESSIMKCGEVSSENAGISDDRNSSMSAEKCNELLERNETSIVECGKLSAESENISKSEDVPENEEIQHGRQEKRLQTHLVEYPVSVERSLPTISSFPLVELFSISVCPYVGNTDECSSFPLYGTIRIADEFSNDNIFDGETCGGALISPYEKIPMVGGSYFGPLFDVELHLRDDKDREISHGIMSWDHNNVEGWFGKRISSVVQGKDGFAAIHYMMFAVAARAMVNVSIRSIDGCVCSLHGKIWTRYFSQSYTTLYDEYFQSVLFQREPTDLINLGDGGKLPLSKSVVAVTFDDLFVVELDLHRVVANKDVQLKDKLLFNPREFNEQKLIKESAYEVTVSLVWLC